MELSAIPSCLLSTIVHILSISTEENSVNVEYIFVGFYLSFGQIWWLKLQDQ